MNLIRKNDFDTLANTAKQQYITRKGINTSSKNINKIMSKITLSEVNDLLQTPLNILLYELSTTFPRYEISCDGGCNIQADTKTYTYTNPAVEVANGLVYLRLPDVENPITVTNLEITSVN